MLDSMAGQPSYVVGRRWDVLAWNRAAVAVFGDYGRLHGDARNTMHMVFANPAHRRLLTDWEAVARASLAMFRADSARYAGDPDFERLIALLAAASAEFRAWWPKHEVLRPLSGMKRIDHPDAKRMSFEYTSLVVVDPARHEARRLHPARRRRDGGEARSLAERRCEPSRAGRGRGLGDRRGLPLARGMRRLSERVDGCYVCSPASAVRARSAGRPTTTDLEDLLMARVFVTGSSTGLGLMAGELLVEQGHRVALHARNAARADETRRALPEAAAVVVGDLSSVAGAAASPTRPTARPLRRRHPQRRRRLSRGAADVDGGRAAAHLRGQRPRALCPDGADRAAGRLVYLSSGMHRGARATSTT